MQTRRALLCLLAFALSACSAPPPEKAIIGSWMQDVPTSTTDTGLQSTTSDAVLDIRKDGTVRLRRLLDLRGAGLPEGGIALDVDLSGRWTLEAGQLVQSLESARVTPRTADADAVTLAEQVQSEARIAQDSVKTIVALDRQQLILQDAQSGTTDVYRRK